MESELIDKQLIADTFDAYYSCKTLGVIEPLATCLLAQTTLVTTCWNEGDKLSLDVRGKTIEAVIEWGIEQLRPMGEHDWTARRWGLYSVLFGRYIQNLSIHAVIDLMQVRSVGTFYNRLSSAFEQVAQIFQIEMVQLNDVVGRRTTLFKNLYDDCRVHQQKILEQISVFRYPVPKQYLEDKVGVAPHLMYKQLELLIDKQLLIARDEGQYVQINPIFQQAIQLHIQTSSNRLAHYEAGSFYATNERHQYEVVYHWFTAGDFQSAARFLLEHEAAIRKAIKPEQMLEMVEKFKREQIDSDTVWGRLQIVAGQLNELIKDVRKAKQRYQTALSCPDERIQAYAHYYLGSMLREVGIDDALKHLDVGIRQTVQYDDVEGKRLFIKFCLKRAWVCIRERPNHQRMLTDLQNAEAIIKQSPTLYRIEYAYWHNVWAFYLKNEGEFDETFEHCWQAWELISKTEDTEGKMRFSHNLGVSHASQKRHMRALEHLQNSLALAENIGDVRAEMYNHRSIGACHYELEQYEAAIVAYEEAYRLGTQQQLTRQTAYTCHDLAEALMAVGQVERAKTLCDEGYASGRALDATGLIALFTQLYERYPELSDAVTERQRKIISFVRQRGAISTAQCMELTGLQRRQAIRELKDALTNQLGVLQIVGKGRNIRYIITS